MPRLSASFGYFRRIQGNFYVMDNEAYGPNDFTEFSVTVPTNARLPQSGQTVGGFLDPIAIRRPQNVIKDASQFGKQKGHWNGFDFSLDARLHDGLYLQGGARCRQVMSDVCEIADDVPEVLFSPSRRRVRPFSRASSTVRDVTQCRRDRRSAGTWTSRQHCHQETPWQAQYKALGSYTLPWWTSASAARGRASLRPQIAAFYDLQRNGERRHHVLAHAHDDAGAPADEFRGDAERD